MPKVLFPKMAAKGPTIYRSFGEQRAEYTNRHQIAIPERPVNSPAAWYGPELAAEPDLRRYALTSDEVEEICRTVADIITSGIGRQYATGLPADSFTQTEIAFFGIEHQMSIPEVQNPKGELLGPVQDYSESASNPFFHLYQTSSNIGYQCAATDIVGLLFLHPEKSGAHSRVVSNVTLFNALLKKRPMKYKTIQRRSIAP